MSDRPLSAFVALGSNLEDPAMQLRRAFATLAAESGIELMARSPVYRSRPLGPADQPDYLNAVAEIRTVLAAEALLDRLQAIESQQGRRRGVRWGPRTLDLDLLLYGDQRIDTERLQVPHPGMAERAFVLVPLADLAPDRTVPGMGTVRSLLAALDPEDIEALEAQP